MALISISKGLDICIKGKPIGPVQSLGGSMPAAPQQIALDLKKFSEVKLRLMVKAGDVVKIGQPLAEDKQCLGRYFVAPAAGVVRDVRRGIKRMPLDIIIDVAEHEEFLPLPKGSNLDRKMLLEALKEGGHFASIRSRPFNILAAPYKLPRSIFVKALESAPLVPPAEYQVIGHEQEFQLGLDALVKLTDGPVHLVHHADTSLAAFNDAKNVHRHSAKGPHPIANASLHIQRLAPISSAEDVIWTIDARAVVAIGHQLAHGQYYIEKIISVAGPGVVEGRSGFYRSREGVAISTLLADRLPRGMLRLISGDPLMGSKVTANDFMGFADTVLSVIPENVQREFMNFFRLGLNKYTFSRAYLSGFFKGSRSEYSFTTSQHGEHRAFIDSSLYDKVMPLDVPTMLLVKAIMAEDYDLACQLGLLEVDAEDFALPTFVCPSKMEMTEIVKAGLQHYSKDFM